MPAGLSQGALQGLVGTAREQWESQTPGRNAKQARALVISTWYQAAGEVLDEDAVKADVSPNYPTNAEWVYILLKLAEEFQGAVEAPRA